MPTGMMFAVAGDESYRSLVSAPYTKLRCPHLELPVGATAGNPPL